MERKRLCQRVAWLVVVSTGWLVNSAVARETLGRNKSPAQTFASDCAACHKSPQGLARSAGGLFGVEGFLREHYTSSKESAAALANYLRSQDDLRDRAPGAPPKAISQNQTNRKRRPRSRPRPRLPTGSRAWRPATPGAGGAPSGHQGTWAPGAEAEPACGRRGKASRGKASRGRRRVVRAACVGRSSVFRLLLPLAFGCLGRRLVGVRFRFVRCRGFLLSLGSRLEHRLRGCGCSGGFFFSFRACHSHVFAARNPLGLVGAPRNRNSDRHLDLRMKRERHLVLANRLDRCIEHDLRAADLGAFLLQDSGDVARGDRAEQLAGLARLTQDDIALAVDLAGEFSGFALHFEIAGLKLGLHLFETPLVVGGSPHGLSARQQKNGG